MYPAHRCGMLSVEVSLRFKELVLFHYFVYTDIIMLILLVQILHTYITTNIVRVVKSKRMRWAGHVARMRDIRNVHRVLVGKPEGKKPLGRPRRRWEYNIKMDLQEGGGVRGDWMELAQDRDRWRALVGTVRDFRVP
jgi:hypothetical protein